MKKRLPILLGCLIALGLVGNWAYGNFMSYFMGYDTTLRANWGIDLPRGYTELYGHSIPSFHGDGVRYHVLDYPFGNETSHWTDRIWKIEQLFYNQEKPTQNQLDSIYELLEQADISQEYIPDFSTYPLITQKQDDNSRLYLMLDSTTGTIYIVEDFL